MTPSSRTYTGIILILFGGSTLFGARGQHAVDFPLMKQRSNKPPRTHTNENSLSGLQEKKKGTESLGKKPQKKPPQKFYVLLSGHFNLHTNENPPRADGKSCTGGIS